MAKSEQDAKGKSDAELVSEVSSWANVAGNAVLHPHRLRALADLLEQVPAVVGAWSELTRRTATLEAEIAKRLAEAEHALQALRDQATAEAGKVEREIASLKAERDALAREVEELTVTVRARREEFTKIDQARRELTEKLAAVRG